LAYQTRHDIVWTAGRVADPVGEQIGEGQLAVAPFRAGETLRWSLAD